MVVVSKDLHNEPSLDRFAVEPRKRYVKNIKLRYLAIYLYQLWWLPLGATASERRPPELVKVRWKVNFRGESF